MCFTMLTIVAFVEKVLSLEFTWIFLDIHEVILTEQTQEMFTAISESSFNLI